MVTVATAAGFVFGALGIGSVSAAAMLHRSPRRATPRYNCRERASGGFFAK